MRKRTAATPLLGFRRDIALGSNEQMIERILRPVRLAAIAMAALMVAWNAAPALAQSSPATEAGSDIDVVNDPLEAFNRLIFEINLFLDGILIKPLALLYRDLIPPEVRTGVHNALSNLRAPVTLANDLMQGEGERAGNTIQRFVINSTVGLGGVLDVATDFGIPGHREDFGQTLATWGSGEGPYLVLPVLGPSNPRDVLGLIVDGFTDPLTYVAPTEALIARTSIRGIDEREAVIEPLDEIQKTSLDFYATLRSLYRQRRDDEIRNGRPAPVMTIPSISIDDFEDEAATTSMLD